MADSEPLLQPEMLAELKRYRTLERRLQMSRQQSQEFKALAKQIAPGTTLPLSTVLRDSSPAAELGTTLSALKQQIQTIYDIEAQIYELQTASRRPTRKEPASLPLPLQLPLIQKNAKIAVYVVSAVVLFVLLLMFLHNLQL